MKRSVAILGHTPQFARWAIEFDCPLRQFSDRSLADSSFRQLRGLRAYSLARVEGRVIGEVCLHPDADPNAVEQARGFLAGEVLDAHGDESFVASQCDGCAANAISLSHPGVWGGCYGLLPVDTRFEFNLFREASEPLERIVPAPEHDLASLIDVVIAEKNLDSQVAKLFKRTAPAWYGIWQAAKFTSEQTEILCEVFGAIRSRFDSCPRDLTQFHDALSLCRDNSLTMHVELVPPGFSDGQHWTISRCCPDCKFEMADQGKQHCPGCRRFGSPHELLRNKVVGLRPYVLLNRVLGLAKTEELVQLWHAGRDADRE